MKYPQAWPVIVLASLLLSACAPLTGGPAAGFAGVRAWFDAPLPGTVYLPPNPCQFVAHGASPGGIAAFELSINGGAASSIPSPDNSSSLVTLSRDCGLSEPGVYNLALRAQDNAGAWSDVAETSLIIEARGAVTAPAPPPPAPPPLVIASATSAVPGGVVVESVGTWVVYAGDASCGRNDVVITARATAPKGIQVVVLFYRYEPGSPSGFQNVAMNPIGGDLYRVSLIPNLVFGGPADAILQYQVVVQQPDGETSIRTPVLADIEVRSCGSAPVVICPSFPDKRACEANGCSWVEVPGLVPVFECRNP